MDRRLEEIHPSLTWRENTHHSVALRCHELQEWDILRRQCDHETSDFSIQYEAPEQTSPWCLLDYQALLAVSSERMGYPQRRDIPVA